MRKAIWMLTGFIFFVLGLSAIILQMVGMNYTFLAFLSQLDPLFTLLIYLFMMLGGIVVVYLQATNWRDITEQD